MCDHHELPVCQYNTAVSLMYNRGRYDTINHHSDEAQVYIWPQTFIYPLNPVAQLTANPIHFLFSRFVICFSFPSTHLS